MQHEDETTAHLRAERDRLRQQLDALEARQAELTATLLTREREIQALLELKPNAVVARFDRQLRHTYVNAAVRLATGIPTEAYIGKTSREMGMPESVLTIWEAALQNVLESGVEQTIDYSFVAAGTKFIFESRIIPEAEPDGGVASLIAITRNITEQKLAQEALQEHNEILQIVHSVGQVISGELDLHKLVQEVTDAATELSRAEFGAFFYNIIDEHGESYTLYTLSGAPREAFSSFPMPRNTAMFGPTFHGEGTVRIDDVHQDSRYGQNEPHFGMPKGHLPVTSYLAVPVISRTNEVLGGLFFGHSQPGVFRERDERIIEGLAAQAAIAIDNARLYREARFQQERLQTTLTSIGDAVIATDAKGRVSFINTVAQSLTGWNAEEAVGKPLETVFPIINEFTREPVENPVAKVIQHNGIVGLANHTLLLSRDGREIPIDDSGAPIREADGSLIGVILVFRDITERKRQEQRNTLLLELSTAFSNALTQHQIAEVVVEQALRALGGTVGTVSLLVEGGTMMEILNLRGTSPAIAQQYRRTPLEYPGALNDAVRTDSMVWVEDRDSYLARYPHFAEVIQRNGSHSTIALPLRIDEQVIGGFSLSFPTAKPRNPEEEGFFRTLAYLCAQSLERARLYEAELELAALVERQRIARELHDAVSQTLFSANIIAESLPRSWQRNPDQTLPMLQDLLHLTRGAAAEMRVLLVELRPENLVSANLGHLLTQLGYSVQGKRHIDVSLIVRDSVERVLPPEVQVAFYRIAQESLNNIIKHGDAAQIRIRFTRTPAQATLIITDNGQGFDTTRNSGGIGLKSMRERADLIRAELAIRSKVGLGTQVRLTWKSP